MEFTNRIERTLPSSGASIAMIIPRNQMKVNALRAIKKPMLAFQKVGLRLESAMVLSGF
jgi:hypothetical protein